IKPQFSAIRGTIRQDLIFRFLPLLIDLGDRTMGIWRIWFLSGVIIMDLEIWEILYLQWFGYGGYGLGFRGSSQGITTGYKRIEALLFIIILKTRSSFTILSLSLCSLVISWCFMMQSQLVGKEGDVKGVEGVRKRLKISIPHFDNSDLIKGYSKTLIGRCMNPEVQKVKDLLMMLPKI